MKVKETVKELNKMESSLNLEKQNIDMKLLEVSSKRMIISGNVFEKKMGEILMEFVRDGVSVNTELFFGVSTFKELLKLHRQSHDDYLMEELKKQNGGK